MLTSTARTAFSLIELLVVISIIAVLASMLMAGVKLARSAALSTKCCANLRQLAAGSEGYSADQEGMLPPAMIDYSSGPDIFWFGLLGPYVEAATNDSGSFTVLKQSSIVWGCPAYKKDPAVLYTCGYGMNMWPREPERVVTGGSTRFTNYQLVGFTTSTYGLYVTIHQAQLSHTASRPLYGDSRTWELPNGAGTTPRHRDKLGVAFCDGHVELLTPAQLLSQRDNP